MRLARALTQGPQGVAIDGNWLFGHDGNGDLTRVTTPSGGTIDLTYDPAGRLERIAYPTAAGMQVTYDALTGRPGSIAHNSGFAELARLDYGFDTDGKITSIADAGGTRSFTYDATLQLTGGGYPTETLPRSESYTYDKEGNRTESHLSPSYIHDMANRLREDDDTCYAYDANGNLVERRERVGLDCVSDTSGATTTYEWDVLNRLTRIDNPDGSWAAYRYDAQGRRIGKDVADGLGNVASTRYVYDGDAIALEYDGANALQARYSHGEEVDQPLAMSRGGADYYYHTDHLGSVRLVTDGAGLIVSRYDYDSFGNIELTTLVEGVANPYGFTAREFDAESGLMFYRARYYDPKLGRFISEDPMGCTRDDVNLYRYVKNYPTVFGDPSGLSAKARAAGGSSSAEYAALAGSALLLGGALLTMADEVNCLFGLAFSGLRAALNSALNGGEIVRDRQCGYTVTSMSNSNAAGKSPAAKTPSRTKTSRGPGGSCQSQYVLCATTTLSRLSMWRSAALGSVLSRCDFCRQQCELKGGEWPGRAYNANMAAIVRCDYWNFPSIP